MARWLGVIILAMGTSTAIYADGTPPLKDLTAVKTRILQELRATSPNVKKALSLVQNQQPDGSWKDIPYDAKDRMLWPPMRHLDRLRTLANAYGAGKIPNPDQTALEQGVLRAFDFWVMRDPQSSNWWYNEIGAPQSLSGSMLLTEPLLTDGRIEKGCLLLARAKLGMTGQNLIWLAENVIGRACLQRDTALMSEAFKRIGAEIVITEKEGIQPDYSFHQHGAQLYSGGYGNGFAASAPRFALLAQNTAFALTPDKIRILENYLLDGQQWMIRGNRFDYSACGREPTRPNSGKADGYAANARSLLKLEGITRREELKRLAERIEKGTTAAAPALTGHRHFWRSDYTVHHTPDWMVSVRMTSTRLQQTEVINEENLLGEHLSDGVMYLYRTGDEYLNIFPVWDWARPPGVTTEHNRPAQRVNNRRRGTRSFAGGLSDGKRGVSAMDFERDGLTAKKAWFFFDDEVVCLGAGITSSNAYRVITSINQCLAKGPVTLKRADGVIEISTEPEKIARPLWAYHNGIGYVFLDPGESVGLGAAVQTGNWKRISAPQKADPVSITVFSLWLNHGTHPGAATYAYVITPQADTTALEAYATASPIRVSVNSPGVQAVEQEKTGVLQAAFYEAASFESAMCGTVSADKPCLLMVQKEGTQVAFSAGNPLNQGGTVTVQACGRKQTVILTKEPTDG